MSKKNIIFFADWFEPGYRAGGPIRSVTNMVSKLSKHHQIFVVTRITDFGSDKPYAGIEQGEWMDFKGAKVVYYSESQFNKKLINKLFDEISPDFIHLNSFFSQLFTILPLKIAKKRKIKVVLAPRGMLGEGALEIKKAKKKIFIAIAKVFGWYKGITWHASTDVEASEIKAVFPKAKTISALNLVDFDIQNPDNLILHKSTDELRLIFLSRISEKKNLIFAIESVLNSKPKKRIQFDIYGPIEDEVYWEKCKSIIKNTNLITIEYKGEVSYKDVKPTFAKYHCFILPTKHENFGHVFIESWSQGCAVLISKNTPWRNLSQSEAGWDIELENKEEFSSRINYLSNLGQNELIHLMNNSLKFANQISNDETNIKNNLTLFHG